MSMKKGNLFPLSWGLRMKQPFGGVGVLDGTSKGFRLKKKPILSDTHLQFLHYDNFTLTKN